MTGSSGGLDVTERTGDQFARMSAKSEMANGSDQNPIWNFPGFRVDKTRSWKSISADIVTRDAGEAVWRSDRHRTVYALTDVVGTRQSDDEPLEKGTLLRKAEVSFVPSGTTVRSDLATGIRFIQILQCPGTYDSLAREMVRGGVVHFEPRTRLDDPLVSQIVLTIANEMEGGVLDSLLAETLNTALAVRLIRQFIDPSAIGLAPCSGLSRERLQRDCDYIEAHLDTRLSLTDLAGVACLSPCHFSRSFKQALGVGPQRYVIQRRVEHAKALMRRTKQPLALIAQETGFADQSHLTAIFRREIGVTPGQFRTTSA
jgi:AraC family transcriptional regulator